MADGAADRNRTRVCAVAPHGSAIELRTRAQDSNLRSQRHLIYSQASLPLEYLCVNDGAGDSCCPHLCWRKVDGSNATPCGAHPFSRRVAGHSSETFRTSRRDLNAWPPPSDGGALSG